MVDARRRTSQAIVFFLAAVALIASHLSYNKVCSPSTPFRELIVDCHLSNTHVTVFILAFFTAKRKQQSATKKTSLPRL
jgi:hypothetical protein